MLDTTSPRLEITRSGRENFDELASLLRELDAQIGDRSDLQYDELRGPLKIREDRPEFVLSNNGVGKRFVWKNSRLRALPHAIDLHLINILRDTGKLAY